MESKLKTGKAKIQKPSPKSKEEILKEKIEYQKNVLLLLVAQQVFHPSSIQSSCPEFVDHILKSEGNKIILIPKW